MYEVFDLAGSTFSLSLKLGNDPGIPSLASARRWIVGEGVVEVRAGVHPGVPNFCVCRRHASPI